MEDAMTRFSLTLSPQTEITGTIIRWDVPKLLENPPLMEITGYASIDPTIPEGPERHLAERSLTIRMDVNAAALLSREILDLVRSQGS
jgi:hypothetical protein